MATKIIISWIFIIGCYACYPRQKKSTIKVKSIFSEEECREYCKSRSYHSYLYFFEDSLMVFNPHDCHCSDNIYYHRGFKLLWPQLRKIEKWQNERNVTEIDIIYIFCWTTINQFATNWRITYMSSCVLICLYRQLKVKNCNFSRNLNISFHSIN